MDPIQQLLVNQEIRASVFPALSATMAKIARLAACALLSGAHLLGGVAAKTITLPNTLHDGPVSAETAIVDPAWIDGPKLSSASNDTTYEWCVCVSFPFTRTTSPPHVPFTFPNSLPPASQVVASPFFLHPPMQSQRGAN
jgi:hypothetical protein